MKIVISAVAKPLAAKKPTVTAKRKMTPKMVNLRHSIKEFWRKKLKGDKAKAAKLLIAERKKIADSQNLDKKDEYHTGKNVGSNFDSIVDNLYRLWDDATAVQVAKKYGWDGKVVKAPDDE